MTFGAVKWLPKGDKRKKREVIVGRSRQKSSGTIAILPSLTIHCPDTRLQFHSMSIYVHSELMSLDSGSYQGYGQSAQ